MVRDQMHEVLLVEVVDDPDRPPPARSRSARVAASYFTGQPHGGVGRWWPVAVGLVLIVAAAWVVAGLRERDRAARLAAEPELLAALRPELAEVWRAPMRGWGRVAAADGDLVLFGSSPQYGAAVELLAGDTGRVRWQTPLPEIVAGGDIWCLPLPSGADGTAATIEHIACRVVVGPSLQRQPGESRTLAQVRIVVLDAATGARLADRALDGTNVSLTAFGPDLLVSERLPGGFARVTREDPLTGEIRWAYRSTGPVRGSGGRSGFLDTQVQHGVVVVRGAVAVALTPDGEVLGEWGLPGDDWAARGGWGLEVSALGDGRLAVGEAGGLWILDDEFGRVLDSRHGGGFAIKGPVLDPVVDDGSADDILFTVPRAQGGMAAQDARTGEQLWAAGDSRWGRAIVLDRRLIVVGRRELLALDARSGELLWSVPVPRGNHGQQVLTDGRVVVVPTSERALGSILRAFDPADGRERWSAPLPGGATQLAVLDGRLVQLTDRELIVLG